MPLKQHPTDPDKLVFVKGEYNLQKPWVGLTSEEVVEIYTNWEGKKRLSWADLIGDVETKLKEKNT